MAVLSSPPQSAVLPTCIPGSHGAPGQEGDLEHHSHPWGSESSLTPYCVEGDVPDSSFQANPFSPYSDLLPSIQTQVNENKHCGEISTFPAVCSPYIL